MILLESGLCRPCGCAEARLGARVQQQAVIAKVGVGIEQDVADIVAKPSLSSSGVPSCVKG
jgi:hypothetical protein